jgi:AraC family transcriptional regulator of adaptative response / DNA-3-methyladenine glycosylase II
VDGFEMALRAIIGQQISVPSARTTLARVIDSVDHGVDGDIPDADCSQPHDQRGEPGAGQGLRGFPTAGEVLALPDGAFRMPAGRRETVRAVARAVDEGRLDLEPGADPGEATRALLAVPGVGAWTAGYVVMRALGDPDVLLHTDVAARRGAANLGIAGNLGSTGNLGITGAGPGGLAAHAERWRPWRSYALIRLWRAS